MLKFIFCFYTIQKFYFFRSFYIKYSWSIFSSKPFFFFHKVIYLLSCYTFNSFFHISINKSFIKFI